MIARRALRALVFLAQVSFLTFILAGYLVLGLAPAILFGQ